MHHDKVPVAVRPDATIKADKFIRDAIILSGMIAHAPAILSVAELGRSKQLTINGTIDRNPHCSSTSRSLWSEPDVSDC